MIQLDEIRARLEAATPGTWKAGEDFFGQINLDNFYSEFNIENPGGAAWGVDYSNDGGTSWGFIATTGIQGGNSLADAEANAHFIAHAKTDIAHLLRIAEAAAWLSEVYAADDFGIAMTEECGDISCDDLWDEHLKIVRQARSDLNAALEGE